MAGRFFYRIGATVNGPVEAGELRRLVAEGVVKAGTLIRRDDGEIWVPAGKSASLFPPEDRTSQRRTPPAKRESPPTFVPTLREPIIKPPATELEIESCWFCFEPILATAKKCEHCGEIRAGTSQSLVRTPAPELGFTSCPSCGKDILATAKKCRHCGRIREATIQPPAQIPAPEVGIKTCPFCGEDIRATARKCKHCGEMLDTLERPDPAGSIPEQSVPSLAQVGEKSHDDLHAADSQRRIVLGVAAGCMIGFFVALPVSQHAPVFGEFAKIAQPLSPARLSGVSIHVFTFSLVGAAVGLALGMAFWMVQRESRKAGKPISIDYMAFVLASIAVLGAMGSLWALGENGFLAVLNALIGNAPKPTFD